MKIQTDKGTTTNVHAIAEGMMLHGKARPERTWDLNATLLPSYEVTRLPRSKDTRKQGSWVTTYTAKQGAPLPINVDAAIRPALSLYERTEIARKQRKYGRDFRDQVIVQPCIPAVGQTRVTVAGSHGSRVETRTRVEVTDVVTGEKRIIFPVFAKYTVVVVAYGTKFTFESSNRAKGTCLDSRDGKRHSLSFALAELTRLLGANAAAAQFRILTGECKQEATHTTVNPATQSPSKLVTQLTKKARQALRAARRKGSRVSKAYTFCGPRLDTTQATMDAAETFDRILARS